jgi:hypothetical protein
MTRLQRWRQYLAELGVEKTPDETQRLRTNVEKLLDSVSYQDYLRYKSLTPLHIQHIARKTGDPYHKVKNTVDVVVHVGKLKFEK